MNRLALLLTASTILAVSPAWAQYYVFGSFCSSCGTASSTNQLYDDGLHDDGAASDGIFGAIITVDQPAGRYYWDADVGPPNTGFGVGIPNCSPCCFCAGQALLWTTGPGDVVHFRYSRDLVPGGWNGQYVSAGPHGLPPGVQLEITLTPDPYWCPAYGSVAPAHPNGAYWEGVMTIPTPGTYPFSFRTTDQTVVYTGSYNAHCPCDYCAYVKLVKFTTTQPNSDVRFQFDPATGLMRGMELGPTPTHASTWGGIKTLYR